jgi:hypothetical protein
MIQAAVEAEAGTMPAFGFNRMPFFQEQKL